MGQLILITGGARSGKSSYALARSEQLSEKRSFIATSPVTDTEMDERIRRHQLERAGRGWRLVEEQLDLAGALRAAHPAEVVLIDCLTLWVNNLLFAAMQAEREFQEAELDGGCQQLLAACQDYPGTVLCVTNEVGMGIVPENALARRYRDLIGRCNRLLAQAASEVVLVCCGIPLVVKKDSAECSRH